jgi:energy-coupling factor transporter ATP-binding protein EcfA2
MSTHTIASTTELAFPYPGLRPFKPRESHLFFGRDEHVFEMFSLLEDHRFLAVVGASGSGKSSLVLAGLLPRLRDEGLLNQRDGAWRFLIMRPGNSPLDALADACQQPDSVMDTTLAQGVLYGGDPVMTRVVLESGPKGLIRVLADARVPEDDNILLLVDQFEELFRFAGADTSVDSAETLLQRRNESLQFVAMLLETARQTERPVHVVLTMRTDFIGDCDQFDGLPQAINDGQFLVPRLSWRQLEQAISGPLQVSGFESDIERSIVDHMLNTASQERDALPLVQHALLRMWLAAADSESQDPAVSESARTLRHITEVEHYLPIGGLSHALDRHASDLFQSLTDEQPRIAERLFRCLAERSPTGQLIRRLTSVREVADIADVTPQEVIDVVEVFRRPGVNFLVTTPADTLTDATSIDISHESLLRQWGTMGKWIESETSAATRYRRLRETVGLNGTLNGTELLDVWRWRRVEKPTAVWARRYGGQYKECMELLRKSLIRSAIVPTILLTLLVVGSLLIVKTGEHATLKAQEQLTQVALKDRDAKIDELDAANTALRTKQQELEQQQKATGDAEDATKALAIESERLARVETDATVILVSIGGGTNYPTPAEFDAYEELADASEELRLSFFRQLLVTSEERYRTQYAFALQAIVGLDTRTRDKVRKIVLENGKAPQEKARELNVTCAMFGTLLEIEGDGDLNVMIAANLDAALPRTTDPTSVTEVLNRLVDLNGGLTGPQAERLLAALATALTDVFEPQKSSPLGDEVIRQLLKIEKLEPEFAVTALKISQALESVRRSVNVDSISLEDFKQQTEDAVRAVLDDRQEAFDTDELWLGIYNLFADRTAVSSCVDDSADSAARDWDTSLQTLIATLKTPFGRPVSKADLFPVTGLVRVIERLGEDLPGEQALAAAGKIVAAMENSDDYYVRESLGDMLGSLGEKLPGEQAVVLARQIVAAMEKTTDYRYLSVLSNALGSLGEKLPGEQALAGARQIVAAMEKTTDSYALASLGNALGSLGKELPVEHAVAGAQQIVVAMEKTTNSSDLYILG